VDHQSLTGFKGDIIPNRIRCVVASAALALPFLLAASDAAAQSPGLCTQPNEHCVVVRIAADAGGAPKASVDVSELSISGTNHVIFWRIENAGAQAYRFPDDGIAFTPEGKQEFTCAAQGNSGLVFRCVDAGRTKGRFKYAVKANGSPAVPVLDPWIINK
jgi:hypothetical protein